MSKWKIWAAGESHNVGTYTFWKCKDSKCSLNIQCKWQKDHKLNDEDSNSMTMLIKYSSIV
jgi:hypothetical protein